MKILHVITGMRKAAGTTTFVENVVNGLKAKGHDVEVVMSPDGFCQCDIIHIHGLWSGLLHKASQFAKKNNIPVVWSTHGMTAPWSMRHKWWKKLPAWLLYQKRDLKAAAAIHCTTELEVEWNQSLGFKNCFIAPLGTRLPPIVGVSSSSSRKDGKVLLFVGRIYPVKGLVNLIKAWAIVNSQLPTHHAPRTTHHSPLTTPNSPNRAIPLSNSNSELELNHNWKLRIVGPDQSGHQAELQNLVRELNLGDSVDFVGPKFGDELSAEYDSCDCLVLPSFTENFGATIVDALAHGKPCMASTFTPWKELHDCGCGWWVSNEPNKLANAIQEMIDASDENRQAMGSRGRELVEVKYTWNAVVKAMVNGYEEILNGRA